MIILGLLLTTLFGFIITSMVSSSLRLREKLPLSFCLGLGVQTLLMFYMALLKIPLTLINISGITLICTVFFAVWIRKRIRAAFMFKKTFLLKFKRLNRMEILLLSLLGIIILTLLLIGIYWPISFDFDAIALYDWRAKVFVLTGGMDAAINRGFFFAYPLFTSMAHTWIYLLGSVSPRVIYPLLYLCFVFLFYNALRKFQNRQISLLVTFLTAITPSILGHAYLAYANFPYTFYLVIGTLYLYLWEKLKSDEYAILAGFLIGLSTWVRAYEPFWIASLIYVWFIAFRQHKFKTPLMLTAIFIIIQQSWRIYANYMEPSYISLAKQVGFSLVSLATKFNFGEAIEVMGFVLRYAVFPLVPVLILLFLFLIKGGLKKNQKHLSFIIFLLFNFIFLFLGGYIFTFFWSGWREIPDSLVRLSVFFYPLIYFAIGLIAI